MRINAYVVSCLATSCLVAFPLVASAHHSPGHVKGKPVKDDPLTIEVQKELIAGPVFFAEDPDPDKGDAPGIGGLTPDPNDQGIILANLDRRQYYKFSITMTNKDASGNLTALVTDRLGAEWDLSRLYEDSDDGGLGDEIGDIDASGNMLGCLDGTCDGVSVSTTSGTCGLSATQPPGATVGEKGGTDRWKEPELFAIDIADLATDGACTVTVWAEIDGVPGHFVDDVGATGEGDFGQYSGGCSFLGMIGSEPIFDTVLLNEGISIFKDDSGDGIRLVGPEGHLHLTVYEFLDPDGDGEGVWVECF